VSTIHDMDQFGVWSGSYNGYMIVGLAHYLPLTVNHRLRTRKLKHQVAYDLKVIFFWGVRKATKGTLAVFSRLKHFTLIGHLSGQVKSWWRKFHLLQGGKIFAGPQKLLVCIPHSSFGEVSTSWLVHLQVRYFAFHIVQLSCV
jgi:hypothetical protein